MNGDPCEPLSLEERELAQRLRRLRIDEPAPVLDAAILAAAKAGLEDAPRAADRAPDSAPLPAAGSITDLGTRRKSRIRWPAALGIAASMMLAVGIAWQLRIPPHSTDAATAIENRHTAILDDAVPAAETESATTTKKAANAATLPASPVEFDAPSPVTEARNAAAHEDAIDAEERSQAYSGRLDTGITSEAGNGFAGDSVQPPPSRAPATTREEEPAQPGSPIRSPGSGTSVPEQTWLPEPARGRSHMDALLNRQSAPQPAVDEQSPASSAAYIRENLPAPSSPVAPAAIGTDTASAGRLRQNISPNLEQGKTVQERPQTRTNRDAERDDARRRTAASANRTSATRSAPPPQADMSVVAGAAAPFAPESWLQRIRELRDQGSPEAAREQLRSFANQYPDWKIPDDLRPLLKD
ncbi:MAG: hypothetical protein LBL59_10295 [Xanthomonadaceae bacterium]|jgi:Meckel syndrome type 1 protein|nr:hypothetical protein [Xanthomonadaceae bacterium]